MGSSAGGVFLPGDPPPSTGQVLTNPTIVGASQSSGAMFFQAAVLTATGATGSTAAAVSIGAPGLITATGTSGAGINFGVPLGGEFYMFKNLMTGALKIYSVGATINGTTGTTAVTVTATGNLGGSIYSTTAGAWQIDPIPT